MQVVPTNISDLLNQTRADLKKYINKHMGMGQN
jgi:hypothetical protein